MKLLIGQQMVMPALEAVRLGKTRNEAAACLTATVLIAPADTYFLKLSVAVGDVVRLLDDGGKEIFLGSVHELDRDPEAVTLTAYDRGVYLTRNELYGVYAGTGRRIAGKIAGELGIPLGAVEDDGLYRTIVTGPGESAFSILRRAVGEGREIAVRDGALTVTKGSGRAVPLPPERGAGGLRAGVHGKHGEPGCGDGPERAYPRRRPEYRRHHRLRAVPAGDGKERRSAGAGKGRAAAAQPVRKGDGAGGSVPAVRRAGGGPPAPMGVGGGL